ncbi:YigZ family protein [bacterium]|nr:YigZ family protein [bacterium]MBU1994633.1 YigZ family protein [bacterium]
MKFVNTAHMETLEVKQSRFIAHIFPFSEYEMALQNLKRLHPKARHFVVAYRYLNTLNQIVEYSSDDGEPKGTSGKPTLFVLQGADIINTAVITVRYFGGTKLGTGGLVRAYSDAINLVLNSATFVQYKQETFKTIYFEYSNLRILEYECQACGIEIIEKIFDAGAVFKIKSSESEMNNFLNKIDRLVEIKE